MSSGKPLSDFLQSLANDATLEKYNSLADHQIQGFLSEKGLTAAQVEALRARNVTLIAAELHREAGGPVEQFIVPAGPTMKGPARFRTTLEGTMDPVPPGTPPGGGAKRAPGKGSSRARKKGGSAAANKGGGRKTARAKAKKGGGTGRR